MVDYRSLSLNEKLKEGLNVDVHLLGSVFDVATINTLIRSGFAYEILLEYTEIIYRGDKFIYKI